MALRINTNVTALTAHANLVRNDDRLSGSIERLSSGLRINRAADDAAGLTISEKLRTQVRGINRAIMNTQDGISLIQTAEGALNEIHSMLQRMRELAIQAANDTLTSTDRLEVQKEIMQLKEDINRISYGTEFNTKKLLDGSGTAVVSTSSPKNLDGVVTGEVLTFSDFSVVVLPKLDRDGRQMLGTAQQQRSAIFVRTDGVIATGSTTLQSLTNFYDQNGYFILDAPQTLYVQGDNNQSTLTVSKDLTLDQLAERMQAAMTTDQLGNGLHFEASTAMFYDFGETNGQFNVTSGKNGKIGRISFTGEESLVKAMGFQETIIAEDPVYEVSSTNMGVPPGTRTTMTTQISGHRAAGLIQGLDLMFQPPTNAYVRTISATLGVNITADNDFIVQDSRTGSAVVQVPIHIGAGQYSMAQVASIINWELENAPTPSYARCKINDSYALEFYSVNSGTSAYVDIVGFTGSADLGIVDGRWTGSGGSPAAINGAGVVSVFDYTANTLTFSIVDAHSPDTGTQITLDQNYQTGGLDSIVEAINLQIGINGLQIRAFNDGGYLKFESLETGFDSSFDVTSIAGGISMGAALRINGSPTMSSTAVVSGNTVDQNFAYLQSSTYFGYVVADNGGGAADDLHYFAADLDGAGFSVVVAAGDAATGLSFRSITSLANMFNSAANTALVKTAAEIDTGTQTIRFYSTVPGESGRITFTDLGAPTSFNTLAKDWNINPRTYDNGTGEYAFTMHVKDSFIQFQIGPNQGHTAKSNIIRTDCKALGIEDLDLTNIRVAEEAIGLIDKALQRVSSERAKLGAIQNRMNYTINSLQVGLENMSAADSRIRDVDMAREVIEMTRFQVLQQSSNAMLAQANVTPQRVLDLLR